MNRLLRIISVFGAVLALSACVAPGYGPRYYGGGGGYYRSHAYSQPAYGYRGGYRHYASSHHGGRHGGRHGGWR